MVLTVAHALGKYPHEVARDMTEDQLLIFIAYLKMKKDMASHA